LVINLKTAKARGWCRPTLVAIADELLEQQWRLLRCMSLELDPSATSG
jgi:hypothetical protein